MARPDSHTIDREIEIIVAQLAVLQRREDDFTRILTDMTRLRDSVQVEKAVLNSRVAQLQSQKIPINWLPSELLIQIFLVFVAEETTARLPYNPAPLVISHICHKWRQLSLTSSQLWSFISYRCVAFKLPPLQAFIDRSGSTEITFTFVSPLDGVMQNAAEMAVTERNTSEGLIQVLGPHFSRVRSITFKCHFAASMLPVFSTMHKRSFPKLRYLDLALCSQDPSAIRLPHLPTNEMPSENETWTDSVLADLRLEQVPPARLPSYLLRTVQVLELSYPPRRTATARQGLFIQTMSEMVQLLHQTPRLHELIITGVSFYWDITQTDLQVARLPEGSIPVNAVEILTLRRLHWKFAYPRDIYPFLSFLVLPRLEHFDLLIAQPPTKRYEVSHFRGNHIHNQDSFTHAGPLSNTVTLNVLKELNISCHSEDTLGSSLRQLLFPSLEKLDIAFVGQHLRKESGLPVLSRLESIFRDPRLPHLTHLTLSHFDIPPGHGKATLAYMPCIISLTLGGCTGVDEVLKALGESYGSVPGGRGSCAPRTCGVRICPRLEELVLWSCNDFHFESLFSVVHARSGEADVGVVGVDVASAVLGRKIRPLKKPRNAKDSTIHVVDPGSHTVSGAISTLIPIEEALHPTGITCIHLEDCPPISEDQVLSLERLGAVVTLR
ncbi:hypothetical protein F5J12DRAFT_712714 [Pisolithus orientalis]|uniref:uncharacterized protein n=1 Tax=Pisolithus orientalis TaxID=936130 RepID=UPI002224D02C|nr:uncharacterized protein F5J12DRAFT_712714 [Pisolithus orientalis]KAI6032588.1 hypothetical protein F5J12DRAFT_712714 [Pisolithus orientalis]